MPTEVILTLVSLGLFILSTVYSASLAFVAPSRLFRYLIFFSIACVAFAVSETLHVLSPFDQWRIISVQFSYSLILLMNPFILHGLSERSGGSRLVIKVMVAVNIALLVLITVGAIAAPGLVSVELVDGDWTVGPIQYVRAIVGMANWVTGIVILILDIRSNRDRERHFFLTVGYILLALGSLLDAVLVAILVPRGTMTLGFFPGLLGGLLLFQIGVTIFLSRKYGEKEEETETSALAMEKSEKELKRLAYFDEMTNRPNRKSFLGHLEVHIMEAQTMGKNKAVFLLDLDNFKDVNDTFGYDFGDLVIRNVGDKIEDRFGIHDRLYRLYGNQFAIVWDDILDRGEALDKARLILDDLTSLVEIDDSNLYMGVSMGAVLLPEDGDDVNEVFRRCESALAEAKRDKNTFFFYSSELESRTLRKMSIVNSLREAMKKDQFDIVYQPIVGPDGTLAELEALIRSRHPGLKDISPEVYIAVAESSGLIIPITWWLLERAAKDSQHLAGRLKNIRININMSPKILKSRDLVDRLMELNRKSPVNGSLIGFEITEGAIIENVDQVLKNLRSLRERGFHMALDDFGTGYSSLSYIKNLPLDTIKIDKRFVSGISRDNRDEALINSIISIASNLKMDLVAEGVEMPNQLAYLNDRGCSLYQGYLFSKPVPLEEIFEKYTTS